VVTGARVERPKSNSRSGGRKMEIIRRMWNDEAGQDLVEYALIIALVGVAIAGGLTVLKGNINTAFTNISTSLTAN
jgi:pilus assembly protein Flp/PilA